MATPLIDALDLRHPLPEPETVLAVDGLPIRFSGMRAFGGFHAVELWTDWDSIEWFDGT